MTTVADLRTAGDSMGAVSYPILEPINAPAIFGNKLSRFGHNYNLSNESHLFRYLVALCGDAGAGQLKKEMLLPRLQQQLEGTHFQNLDRLYGNPLALPRLNEEIYTYNPEGDILTRIQWDEVLAKDASYRARCLVWMRAILAGPTLRGIKLAAEAAIGIESDVWERYQYVQNPTASTDFGKTGSVNEFVVIPRTPTLLPKDTRQISRLLDMIKPVSTIGTIYTGQTIRGVRAVRATGASSTYFQVDRSVTGRADINWPTINVSNGYWIDTTARQAPTYAFMNRQESVTYLSVANVTASSTHLGYFNAQQQQLFSHLQNVNNTYTPFKPEFSFDNSIAPINLGISWTGGGSSGNNIVVNNSYPLGYFSTIESALTSTAPIQQFWASDERFPTATTEDTLRWGETGGMWGDDIHFGDTTLRENREWIMYDFGRTRPVNYIHFEICQKPIDWIIQYKDGSVWKNIPLREDFDITMSSSYLPSSANPWSDFDAYFDTVQTQYIRILFNRRDEAFPLVTSDPIAFSIEVRGTRLMHTIPVVEDFVADAGIDILGNAFSTSLITYNSSNAIDGTDLFWKSQPNPSRFAVESMYFDLRLGLQPGYMSYLDTQFIDELDTRSISDMENFYVNGQLVDEIYVDPITYGPDMHFYYSDDETPEWDEKLWVPIPRDYILKKGFHALPRPTFVKFFKVEFSNLVAIPYEPVQFPVMPNVTFRRFPLWVANYFNSIYESTTKDVIQQVDSITIDPLTFGFVQIDDRFISNYEAQRSLQLASTEPEVTTFIQNILNQTTAAVQAELESQIQFKSIVMWQSDLVSNLDPTRALSRVAQLSRNGVFDTGWNSELPPPSISIPVQASSNDLSASLSEKTRPSMWFPRRCRHQYQISKAPLDRKIAYVVGIREIGFYRRNYTTPTDEDLYVETLDDTAHVEINDFVQNDWRYVVV